MADRNRFPGPWDGESARDAPPGRAGSSGRGRRRAAMAGAAAGAAALGAVLALPGNPATLASGLTATTDAAVSHSGAAGAGASLDAAASAAAPELAWRSCDGDLQCATARVPLDYRRPGGAKISLQLIRRLATDPAHRIGSLFVNTGGPSQQVDLFPQLIVPGVPAAIGARYDVVTFDPRGFGHSTEIKCFPSIAAENAFFAKTPAFPVGAAQQAAYERTYARFGALCGQRNGGLLDHDTTADSARDMDLLRQAVHDPVMNYVGISYGTGIGEVYANLFPGKVGHMLLDASLDPVVWSSSVAAAPISLRDGSAQAAAAGMNGFLNLCGQASTSACAFSAGSPAATRAKWNTLQARLLRRPVSIGSPAQTITYADVIAAVPPSQAATWPQAAAMLQQVWTASGSATASSATGGGPVAGAGAGSPGGRPGGLAAAASGGQASAAGSVSPTLPAAYNGAEQSVALFCSDTSNPRDPAVYPAIAKSATARFGGFGALATWNDEPCAQWAGNGAPDRYTGPWNRRTANTVLVFGNTGDVAVNFRDSAAAARDLGNARLLTVNEFGHSEALNPDACATSDEVSYLLTGALPPVGAVCQADASPFPAS
jgi:pimeloyl-ACP methyl ester carboxylesterase